MSQLAKPALHDAIEQLPVLHDALAFGRLHAVSHAPQSLSVRIEVSQPLPLIVSQSAKPAAHVAI